MGKKNKKASQRASIPDLGAAKEPPTSAPAALVAVKPAPPPRVKLNYVDPGAERKLPQPPRVSIGAGDRVRLKKAQEYGDGVVAAGEVGTALHPSSQAACWCVSLVNGGPIRVVPEWLLEPADPGGGAH